MHAGIGEHIVDHALDRGKLEANLSEGDVGVAAKIDLNRTTIIA